MLGWVTSTRKWCDDTVSGILVCSFLVSSSVKSLLVYEDSLHKWAEKQLLYSQKGLVLCPKLVRGDLWGQHAENQSRKVLFSLAILHSLVVTLTYSFNVMRVNVSKLVSRVKSTFVKVPLIKFHVFWKVALGYVNLKDKSDVERNWNLSCSGKTMFWQPLCCGKCLDFMLNSVLSNLSLQGCFLWECASLCCFHIFFFWSPLWWLWPKSPHNYHHQQKNCLSKWSYLQLP